MNAVPADQSQASYKDILALPPHLVGEIVRGVLHAHPRPAPKHVRSASKLGAKLDGPFDEGDGGPGGWWILDEPELHFGSEVLVPDLAGWRRDRMPALPDSAWFELAPDWVCEVLSPSTARLDRVQKMPIYAEVGVEYLWLIDPDIRTLETYRRTHASWTLLGSHADDARVRAEPFDAVELELGALWA